MLSVNVISFVQFGPCTQALCEADAPFKFFKSSLIKDGWTSKTVKRKCFSFVCYVMWGGLSHKYLRSRTLVYCQKDLKRLILVSGIRTKELEGHCNEFLLKSTLQKFRYNVLVMKFEELFSQACDVSL